MRRPMPPYRLLNTLRGFVCLDEAVRYVHIDPGFEEVRTHRAN